MRYSLNQIEHTCRKAVRGAGLSWGVAEDVGRAIRWLEMMQYSGVASLAALLEEKSNIIDTQIYVTQEVDNTPLWRSTCGCLSALIAGPCIGDYINASKGAGNLLKLEMISYPELYLGFIGAAICQTGRTARLIIDNKNIEIQPNKIFANKGASLMDARTATNLQLELIDHAAIRNTKIRIAIINSREVAASDWQILETFAHYTYVKSTDASRISGAGAGLSDND